MIVQKMWPLAECEAFEESMKTLVADEKDLFLKRNNK
jgi:hypothetical protein